MILADKIMCLRKQKGWSQEELANKMNVSRQSVSKWESESTVPEMDKIVLLSSIFNVSTDYLLKEDMTDDCIDKEEVVLPKLETAILGSQDVGMYIKEAGKLARHISTGVSLGILAITAVMISSVVHLNPIFNISSTAGFSIGLGLMILLGVQALLMLIKGASSQKIINNVPKNCLSHLHNSDKIAVEKEKKEYSETYQRGMRVGGLLLPVSIIPMLTGAMYNVSETNIILLSVLFLLIGNIAIHILIRVSIKVRIFDRLLKSKKI